jgi:formylglycine-generating enzyme required for sulfatase activity
MRNFTQSMRCVGRLGLALLALDGGLATFAQAPVVSSFGQNGVLVCTNLQPGSVASVEWAPTVAGPWTNTWTGLEAIAVASNGTLSVSVPMFYRVRGLAQTNTAPAGMALIPAGSFTMGDSFTEGYAEERPTHTVHVSAFYLDKREVTKALWDEVAAWNGGNGYAYEPGSGLGKATNHPVHTVTWYDVVKWCNARSQKEGLVPCYYADAGLTSIYKTNRLAPYVNWSASGYRLPTEAEWEKAARGGASGQRFPWGNTISWSWANYYAYPAGYAYDVNPTEGYHPTFASGDYPYTSPVASFAPNDYGLHDMTGNVWEWCWDWFGSYSSDSQSDPCGPASGSYRMNRGGGWSDSAVRCRVAFRNNFDTPSNRYNAVGFRCARAAGQ